LITVIIILSVIFSFSVRNIGFDGDIANMNYQPDKLTKAENELKKISSETLSSVYLISSGKTLEEALRIMDNKRRFWRRLGMKDWFPQLLYRQT
jgi:hypothetical protein